MSNAAPYAGTIGGLVIFGIRMLRYWTKKQEARHVQEVAAIMREFNLDPYHEPSVIWAQECWNKRKGLVR